MKNNVDLKEILDEKNQLIINQTRRISFLEDKLMEIRKKYFELKYDDEKLGVHIHRLG